jgi:hypothetical protein
MEIKVVDRDGKAVVVEWVDNGRLKRGVLPAKDVKRGKYTTKTALRRAAPYGLPWEELVQLRATSEDLAEQLRKRGIWNLEDLWSKGEEVQAAIMATYRVDMFELRKLAQGGVKDATK